MNQTSTVRILVTINMINEAEKLHFIEQELNHVNMNKV